LERLEDAARESAAAEVRAAWRALGDEEVALLVAPYYHGRAPTPRERAAEERARGAWPDEEVGRRMRGLLDPVVRERRARVRRRLIGMEDGR
jgi:hypothetical protein